METQTKCYLCGAHDFELKRGQRYHFTESGLGNVFLLNVEMYHCVACGEDFVSIPRSPELLRCIGEAVVLKPNILIGAEIRFLRKNLHLGIGNFAELIGHHRVTVSRWENDQEAINKPADRLIRLAYVTLANVSQDVREKLKRRLQEEQAGVKVEYDIQLPLDPSSCGIKLVEVM